MTSLENSPSSKPWLNAFGSRYFVDFLEQERCSLAFSTYETGKLFLVGRKDTTDAPKQIGRDPENALSIFERTLGHCMGMCASADGRTIWLSSRFQIWRLEQAPAHAVPYRSSTTVLLDGQDSQLIPHWVGRGYDVAYIPRVGYTTGFLDVHDMGLDSLGRLIFVNTSFGCLATLSDRANFKPLWRPPFLSAIVPEDRCHLNGLAMRDGKPAYVTVVGRSDVADGWRDMRQDGGCILDVETGEVVCSGLSMPHSPRWYHDKLWVLNSGTGGVGYVETENGKFIPIAFCPGYLRGLSFVGHYAIATLSKPRHESFRGLALDERLKARQAEPQCGLQIIDLRNGSNSEWLKLEGSLVTELYDSVVLPGVRQPMVVGFKTPEIERLMLLEEGPN